MLFCRSDRPARWVGAPGRAPRMPWLACRPPHMMIFAGVSIRLGTNLRAPVPPPGCPVLRGP
eukprot:8785440-Alexandrium_andersonii.AAC.1